MGLDGFSVTDWQSCSFIKMKIFTVKFEEIISNIGDLLNPLYDFATPVAVSLLHMNAIERTSKFSFRSILDFTVQQYLFRRTVKGQDSLVQ